MDNSKKYLAELADSVRIYIMAGLLAIMIMVIIIAFVQNMIFGIFSAVILLGIYISIITNGFKKFQTNHNYAQLAYGDTILEITFEPGDIIWILPGYHIVEKKGDLLLTTEELSMKLPSKEVQFAGENNTDSIEAKDLTMDYFIIKNSIYNLLMKTPKNYVSSCLGDMSGDLSTAFLKRVANLKQAQEFKDFKYYSQKIIDDNDIEKPSYVSQPGVYLTLDEGHTWSVEKKIVEFETTLKRLRGYGFDLHKITVSDYVDSDATDESRNAIKRQELKNIENKEKSKGRLERVKDWLAIAEKDPDIKDKLIWATNQVNMEDGGRREVDTGGKALINIDEN